MSCPHNLVAQKGVKAEPPTIGCTTSNQKAKANMFQKVTANLADPQHQVELLKLKGPLVLKVFAGWAWDADLGILKVVWGLSWVPWGL